MSRRSLRLLTSGYYRTDGEMNSNSSSHQVSYRESPVRVFKRRTGSQKQTLSRTGSLMSTLSFSCTTSPSATPCLSFSSLTTEDSLRGVVSALKAATQSQSCCVGPASGSSAPPVCSPSSWDMPRPRAPTGPTLLNQSCVTSGYSSSEECEGNLTPTWRRKSRLLSRSRRTSSSWMFSGDAEPVETHSFTQVLFACLALLCCRLFGLLREVLLLSSGSQRLRKAALTVLALTLCAAGFWYCYLALTSLLMSAGPVWPESSTSTIGMNTDPRRVADFSAFRKDVLDHISQEEVRWKNSWTTELDDVKREMGLLQRDGERHRHMTEILQAEMKALKDLAKNNDLDQHTWMTEEVTGVATKVADLKDSVMYLRTAYHNLRQHLEDQENISAQLKKELTDWLKGELQAGLKQVTGSVVLRPELQGVLEALEKRLQRLAEEVHQEHSDAWRAMGESLKKEGLGTITVKDVHGIVQRALSLYRADGIGMADYALESLGATVIQSSETYYTRSPCVSLFGMPLWYASESPRTVIQPEMHPGKCWAFKGGQGFITIALSLPVLVTHVTMEHIPKILSPTGHIDSAPREFAVYGLSGFDEQEEGRFLGRFTYNSDGEPIQTFELLDSVKEVYRAVQLRVLSNWGNPEYSCVYRFRVHGQPLPH